MERKQPFWQKLIRNDGQSSRGSYAQFYRHLGWRTRIGMEREGVDLNQPPQTNKPKEPQK